MRVAKTSAISVPAIGVMVLAMTGLGSPVAAQSSAPDPGLTIGLDLEMEAVEPGVFHVVSDGVRELSHEIEFLEFNEWGPPGWLYRTNATRSAGISANASGIWLRRPEGIVRLGEEELVWSPKPGDLTPEFDVASDGTLYQRRQGLVLTDGEWRPVRPRVRGVELEQTHALRIAPDGTRWIKGTNGRNRESRRPRLARRDDDGWVRVESPPRPPQQAKTERHAGIGAWGVAEDGVVYVQRDGDVQRFDGSGWETLTRPDGGIQHLLVGTDGTVWVNHSNPASLTRLDGDEWTMYDVPPHLRLQGLEHAAVGLDGAYWYTPMGDPMSSGGCDGVIRTDGPTSERYLRGTCVYDIAIGPGGGVWVEATTWTGDYQTPESIGPLEVYLIAPDAALSGG